MQKPKINEILTKNNLLEDYIEKHKTDKTIGEKYGFHEETVRRYRQKLGISRYVTSSINELNLTQEQKEIINGTIMGDAHINIYGSMEISHSIKQYSYIYWLHSKMLSIASDIKKTTKNKYRFRTKSLDYLKTLRNELYPNNIKIVTAELLNKLTPLSLAVWFQDDAYLENGSNYVLCTQGFTDEDRDIISGYFKSKFDINTKIKKLHSKRYAKYYYAHVFDHENSTKLTKIIKYHILPCFLYKILNSERKHVIYLAGGMQRSPDGGVKWRRNIKQLLNQRGYYCIDPTKEENCLLLDDGWRDSMNNNFELFQKNMRIIIDRDLYFVKMSENIVCLYDDYLGGGTFHEMGESYLLNKKLYIINGNQHNLKNMNWWALGCCTKIVNSYEDLIKYFPNISDEPYVPYHKN
jgi:hypothetical protein